MVSIKTDKILSEVPGEKSAGNLRTLMGLKTEVQEFKAIFKDWEARGFLKGLLFRCIL